MKRISILTILLSLSTFVVGQNIKLNKEINIDTLTIWVDYSEQIEPELTEKIQESVLTAVERFNNEPIGFVVDLTLDSSNFSMKMTVGEIDYVVKKDNILWTSVGLLTLAGHVYVISTIGWTLPILLIPSTVSEVQIQTSENLVTNKPKQNRIFINPMGYLRKKEKQNEKIVLKTEKVLYRFLKRIGKQDERNNRP